MLELDEAEVDVVVVVAGDHLTGNHQEGHIMVEDQDLDLQEEEGGQDPEVVPGIGQEETDPDQEIEDPKIEIPKSVEDHYLEKKDHLQKKDVVKEDPGPGQKKGLDLALDHQIEIDLQVGLVHHRDHAHDPARLMIEAMTGK